MTATKAGDANYLIATTPAASVAAQGLPPGIDLTETIVSSPATANAGASIQISDTVSNSLGTNAGSNYTFFYLVSGTGTKTTLGSHYVTGVAGGSSYGPVVTTLTVPVNLSGSYSLMACADDYKAIAETNENNNCVSAPIAISGADLKEDQGFVAGNRQPGFRRHDLGQRRRC